MSIWCGVRGCRGGRQCTLAEGCPHVRTLRRVGELHELAKSHAENGQEQCEAVVKYGLKEHDRRCLHAALPNSMFCAKHQPESEIIPWP